jgi:hypothetical protein
MLKPFTGASVIPTFGEFGYLPPGVHLATIEEIDKCFGRESEIRRVQMESLRWLCDACRRAGVKRLVVNGSFVTDELEPNDVDCVLLIGPDFPLDSASEVELLEGIPFLELSLVSQDDFDLLVNRYFATDRLDNKKGMVEVVL